MQTRWTRRTVLKAAGAAGLSMPFVSRAFGQNGSITIGMEAGSPYDTFYRNHAAEFTAETGVAVSFVSIPHDNIRQQFVQDALSGAGGFDVYIADQVWLPEFYQNGFIADLSGIVDAGDRSDFSATAIETVSYDGALVALPIMVHNCAMYWRKDILQAAGYDAPPRSWDEYRAIARACTSGGNWGTMILSKQGIEAATRLNSFYQQAGGEIVDASGNPTLNTAAGRAALEFMKAMVDEGAAPQGVLELPDMQGAWLEGKLALAPVWPYLYSLSLEPIGAENFAIDTAPGNPEDGGTVYSWGFAAATGARNPDAAAQWVKWATNTQQLYNFGKEWLNPVPRNSAIELIRGDASIAESDKAAIAAFAASAAAGKSMPMLPSYSQLLDVLGIMQSGLMSGALSVDQALEEGQARAEQIAV